MKKLCFVLFIMLFCTPVFSISFAEEGMWMLHTINELPLDRMKDHGLALSPDQIFNQDGRCVSKAVIRLAGGTAGFVSKDGLIVTNHHVAFGALQKQATAKDNIIRDGFWARSRDQEVPAKNYTAHVLIGYRKATEQILSGVTPDMAAIDRFKTIEQNTKDLIEAEEKDKDIRCEVYSNFEGLEYYLFTYFLIKDIRVVYAPPESIGSYGGDIDNWMWPRHAGDFAFLRAYVSPEGKSAPYDNSNVPYHPTDVLEISTQGVLLGDLALVIGNPYRTRRYRSSVAIHHTLAFELPWKTDAMHTMIEILDAASAQDEDAAVKLASRVMGLKNYYKNLTGVQASLTRIDLAASKRQMEQAVLAALANRPKDQKEFADALQSLEQLYTEQLPAYVQKSTTLDWMTYFCNLMRFAVEINKWSLEKQKESAAREPEYMERNIPQMRVQLENAQKTLHVPTDRKLFVYFIQKSLALPDDQRIRTLDRALGVKKGKPVSDKKVDRFIRKLYDTTQLGDVTVRLEMFDSTRDQLLAKKDTLIAFAADLQAELDEIREKEKAFGGATNQLRPKYIGGLLSGKSGPSYPDANHSVRFSWGTVQGYTPQDAVRYEFMTSLQGQLAKNTGQFPFNLPDAVVKAHASGKGEKYIDSGLKDVPIDFLSTNDGTGGNSGSPVLNGKGQIVGLMFDGNFESIASDYHFDAELTRAIHVDIRYVLYVLDVVYGITNVLDELTIR